MSRYVGTLEEDYDPKRVSAKMTVPKVGSGYSDLVVDKIQDLFKYVSSWHGETLGDTLNDR